MAKGLPRSHTRGEFAGGAGKSVSLANVRGIVYIKGDERTDGSVRVVVGDDGQAQAQRRTNGVWNPSELELSERSLLLGRETVLSALGHHLAVEGADVGEKILMGGSHFSDVGTEQPHAVNLAPRMNRLVVQPDDSLEVTFTDHLSLVDAPFAGVIHKLYLKMGAVGASADVRIRFSRPGGPIIFDHNYPSSVFPASIEVVIDVDASVEFPPGGQFNVRVTSDQAFGILHDATGALFWAAMDAQEQSTDFVLTETLVLSNDLCLTFSNAGELAQGNVF